MADATETTDSPYERRLLAFLDVLGWGDLVMRSAKDPTLVKAVDDAAYILSLGSGHAAQSNARTRLFDEVLKREPSNPDLRACHFSDCFVISAPVGQGHAIQLADLASEFSTMLLKRGLYVRGAMVVGPIHHSVNVIYGPALVERLSHRATRRRVPSHRGFARCPRTFRCKSVGAN